MAHVIQITDNTTTVNLNSGNIICGSYQPRTPSISVDKAQHIIASGNKFDLARYDVAESLELLVQGTSMTNLQSNVQTVDRLLVDAAHYEKTGLGRPVYLQVQWNGEVSTWRSQIARGMLDWSTESVDQWTRLKSEAVLTIQRRFFWERTTTVSATLSNAIESGVTNLTIWSSNVYYQATTLSFDNATSRINDSAAAIPASFAAAGAELWMRSTSGTNDGVYSVASATTSYIEVNEALTTESAAAAGTVTLIGPVINYANVDDTVVLGNIPTPAKIALQNKTGGSVGVSNVYIGHNVWSEPYSLAYILQGQNSTGGTDTASSAASNGFYNSQSWAANQDHTTTIFQWTLDGLNHLFYGQGNYFRVLARFFSSPPADTYLKMAIKFPAGTPLTTLYETAEVKLAGDTSLQDLGVLQIPPVLRGFINLTDLALVITVRNASSGTLALDYLQLTPLDSYRHIRQLGYSLIANEYIIDDGTEGYLYSQESGGNQFPILSGLVSPIHLWPNKDQRLYFLIDTGSDTPVGHEWELTVSFRPRRLTI